MLFIFIKYTPFDKDSMFMIVSKDGKDLMDSNF